MFKFIRILRVVIKSIRSGKIQIVDAKGNGEEFTDKELFQQFGFTSNPKDGGEGVIVFNGQDNGIVIATEDRRYRIPVNSGEARIYNSNGDFVYLKTDGTIEVTAKTKVLVTAPQVEVAASAKVTLTTPLVETSADMTVGGDLSVAGIASVTGNINGSAQIADVTGSIGSMRSKYNSHTHPENGTGGGTTSPPNQSM